MAEFLIGIVTLVILTVVINKTTEDRLHAIKPHLREIWWVLGFIYVTYWIWRPESEKYFMTLKHGLGASYPMSSYVLVGILGFVLFTGYWWSLGIVLPAEASEGTQQPEDKKPPEPSPPAKKPNVQQDSKGNNSPNTNQQSSGTSSPNLAITNSPNSTINYNDPNIKARLEEIKQLLLAQQGERVDQDKLLAKYPLGYVIFDIDLQSGNPTSMRPSVLPYETHSPWEFDWSPVRLKEEKIDGKDLVSLTLPTIREKSGHGLFMYGDNSITGLKRAGPFAGGGSVLESGNVAMKINILAIREDGIVFLIGFTRP
jgi:hypothetical protein